MNPNHNDLNKIAYKTAPSLGGICFRNPGRMHQRITGNPDENSVFHVMSRTTGGEMLFGDVEKEGFRMMMWKMARFAGVEILTYCVMGNHFHMLVRVPRRKQFLKRFECDTPGGEGEQRLLEHLKLLYSKAYLLRLNAEITELRNAGREAEVQKVLARFKARFCDISLFVKEVKERFSRWFNKRHSRRGTLWMDRFRSVLVEDGACLRTMAAYIDLNPVRAGLVEKPEDYRWCGYAEALGGSKRLRRGLCRAIGWPIDHWECSDRGRESGAEAYRCILFEGAAEREDDHHPERQKKRHGIELEAVRNVLGSGGKLEHGQLLHYRVRWFSEGIALGSEDYLRRALGKSVPADAFKELPIVSDAESEAWHSLSRLRRTGIG